MVGERNVGLGEGVAGLEKVVERVGESRAEMQNPSRRIEEERLKIPTVKVKESQHKGWNR